MSALSRNFAANSRSFRSDLPLSEDQIRQFAPSIFAEGKHESRSERYTYIPTIEVVQGLMKEGFQPFMVAQSRSRIEGKADFTKHMLRLRHASQINSDEANEIVLLNSHDGTSSYQMLAGCFRFVCKNGMVLGDTYADIRIPHKGDVGGLVIEGAYSVLDQFEEIDAQKDSMKSIILSPDEQEIFAEAALPLRFEDNNVPITPRQVLDWKRSADRGNDLWRTFNRVQENLIRGGISGRSANGKKTTTRPVSSLDRDVKLNRQLWALADKMREIKA